MGINAAQTQLMLAQAKLANNQADKIAGVDTENTKADTELKIANTGNVKADTELRNIEVRIMRIDEWVKDKTKEDAAAQITWTAEKTMNEMNNRWREGLLSAAQYDDKVSLLKAELAGKVIENEYTEQKTRESKSTVEVNRAEIRKKTAEILQGWEKLSQSEKVMKVEALVKEYQLLFEGALGNWRAVDPEVTTKQIDKVMGLERQK